MAAEAVHAIHGAEALSIHDRDEILLSLRLTLLMLPLDFLLMLSLLLLLFSFSSFSVYLLVSTLIEYTLIMNAK